MSVHARPLENHSAEPVGGRLMTVPFRVLVTLGVLGVVLIAWRMVVGLGAATGLTDAYPWGLWIAFDVVTGTALGCGGYAVAILLYILNKGRYHSLIRPAILTSALGYTMAALAITIDVGRPWFIWRIPLGGFPDMGSYNWNSALLEVALCVMAYVVVLWIELSPAFFERWEREAKRSPRLAAFSRRAHPLVKKSMLWIVALGVLLPTLHQSSLGSLMLLTGPKLHALWNTAWLPLLFLLSCVTMGYAAVVIESSLSSRFFGRRSETPMLGSLYGAASLVIALFVALRLGDIAVSGKLGLLFQPSLLTALFWAEILLVAVPAALWLRPENRRNVTALFRGALMILLAGALYRFDTYLVAFNPGPQYTYFPTLPEILVTVGIVAIEVAVYLWLVKRFPILSGAPARAAEAR